MSEMELKPCPNPWCNPKDKRIIRWELNCRQVFCTCGVKGPRGEDDATAVALWNNRAAKAVEDVASERERQITEEGWTPDHDDEHEYGEMLQAAICYAREAGCAERPKAMYLIRDPAEAPEDWPWSPEWWKPKTERHDLIRAAALIIAEIERLDRAAALNREA